ncbi:MAG: homoserine dehydrogenase [Desulfobacterales bacterium]|jgi:homoserine dehydrogenase|nr:homoserine dehydrogenase [Desulfobacterales bacterium]
MRQINIGLLGCGTVGTGVARMLTENRDLIAARLGAVLNLTRVADLEPDRDRGVALPAGVMVADAHRVVAEPGIDIIVEMIGGEGIARELILSAIENGRHVVTANKALLAAHGNALFQAAAAKGVDLFFEASVGGCMPVIKTLREALVGNRILAMTGILNGTCNYILSKITDEGSRFADALAKAQKEGYAEADPALDVEGRDTAHKLAIMSALAFGMEINLREVYIEGISHLTPLDIELAGQFGYRIKLLAIGKAHADAVEMRVHPTMIPFDNILSNVNGTLNAVSLTGDACGEILLYGRGAGMMPTASAVVGDLVDLARNILSGGAAGRLPGLAYQMANIRRIPVLPIEQISTHYYFRFAALDRPGVLSTIAGILGRHGISIQSVQQKGRKSDGAVPVVMLSHRAREADVQQALAEISALEVSAEKPVLIRIEDHNLVD